MKVNHVLSITDLSPSEIWEIFTVAKKLKSELKIKGSNQLLQGKSLVLIFEKPSLRTRVSFEIGMTQFGGHTVCLGPSDVGIGTRESVADVAKVVASMADMVAARTYRHQTVIDIAENSNVPVINALSDLEHPCQALTDLFTIWEVKGTLKGLTVAYVGDGENNVAHSLTLAAAMMGMAFRYASPKGYQLDESIVKKANAIHNSSIVYIIEPKEAVEGTDVVVTDTWMSMGDTDKEKRMKIFKPYQVNAKLMQLAKKDALFMHCLPAHRGDEVTTDVIDGKQSVVFQEAENRLHVQKALLLYLLGVSV